MTALCAYGAKDYTMPENVHTGFNCVCVWAHLFVPELWML